MQTNEQKIHTGARNFVLALILLVLTNLAMGYSLHQLSKRALREQINSHMLDVSNTAAFLLDGDALGRLTAEDAGTEDYQRALATLDAFQQNIELEYIYAVRKLSENEFVFTIDPDPVDPCEFGEAIFVTDGLKAAANGAPGVDTCSHTDEYGRFYSAYSPVFDAQGNVAGIVGVDFDADWYDAQLDKNWAATLVITLVSLTIGIVLSVLISARNRHRFSAIYQEMYVLDEKFKVLDQQIMKSSVHRLDLLPDDQSEVLKMLAVGEQQGEYSTDAYAGLSVSIQTMQKKLSRFIQYIESQFYVDSMTGVGNKAAYKTALTALDQSIQEHRADFSVAFFDINDLKDVNTNFGFELGDTFMYATADSLKKVFGNKNVYRVASDEFIVLLEHKAESDVEGLFHSFERELREFNTARSAAPYLSVAKGTSTYHEGEYENYRQVFVVAEARMQEDKAKHHGTLTSGTPDPGTKDA